MLLLVGVYVDDFCFISDSQVEVDKLKAYLASHGAVEVDSNKWLSLTFNHDVLAGTLSISNEINIMKAHNDFGLTDCKRMNTPAAPGTKLYKTVPTDDVSDGTKAKGLIFRRGDGTLTLKAFCDADFGGERSTTGLLVYLHGVVPCTGSPNFKQ